MELVALLRILWRYRIAVVAGAVVAGALGFLAMSHGATSVTGVASTRVLLDTPRSQTVDADPKGIWTVEWRAELLADLASAEPTRRSVARTMRIPLDKLVVSAPYMTVAPAKLPLPEHALQAAAVLPQPYQVSVQAATALPIINIDTVAPDKAGAARLAQATIDALAAESRVHSDPAARFVISAVGPVHAKAIVNRPRRMIAALVALIVFGAWCSGITAIAAVSRARQRRRRYVALSGVPAGSGSASAAGAEPTHV